MKLLAVLIRASVGGRQMRGIVRNAAAYVHRAMLGCVSDAMHVPMHRPVRDTMRRGNRMRMRRADAMHLVAARVVAVMCATVATRKTKERHGSHTSGSENHTEDV
jgi:hypothetical protein